MAERIFENAKILRGFDLNPVDGFLRIVDGEIEEIGRGSPPESGTDLNGSVIMPPFINGHTHVGDSVAKEIYAGRTQPEVVDGGGYKFKVLERSSRGEKVSAIRDSLLEMKSSGTIAHIDFREGGMSGLSELKDAEISGLSSLSLTRPDSETEVKKLLSQSDGIGVPSLESYSGGEIEKISRLTASSEKLLSFHVSETKTAHKKSLEKTEKTEIERALEFEPSFLIHGVWAESEDLELLSNEDVPLVMCPRSNSLLSTGIPPIKKALDMEVELWLGTDNVSVCSPVMFQELSFAWRILRQQDERASSSEARELLKAATVNPVRSLNLGFGPLIEGGDANFLVISRNRNMRRLEDPFLGLVNRVRQDNISRVFLPGDGS